MIECVIFDMDGLLFDSEIYWEKARREYCRSLGCDWRPEDELRVKGFNSPEWARSIRERCNLELETRVIIDGVVSRMKEFYAQKIPVLPGAIEVVRDLARRYRLGLASSSPLEVIEYVLREEAGIHECFSVIVSSDEVARGKPSPDVFLLAVSRLGCVPDRTVVFEDSSAGILAAHSADMPVIAVPNAHYPPSDESLRLATLVLHSLLDFRPEMLAHLDATS